MFRLSGTVVAVDIAKDKEGKSRGFAIIVYDHPVEAVQERELAFITCIILLLISR